MTVSTEHDQVDRCILLIRGHRVMLDADLAKLYGVTTKRLNEQVQRNRKRFPSDFKFQLTLEEVECIRSQFATLKAGRGQHRKYRPYAFTEQGVAMLSRWVLTNYLGRTDTQGLDTRRPAQKPSQAVQKGRPARPQQATRRGVLSVVR
jgi:hypothetical protein